MAIWMQRVLRSLSLLFVFLLFGCGKVQGKIEQLSTGWEYRWGDGGGSGLPSWLAPAEQASAEWKPFSPPGSPPDRAGRQWMWNRVRLPDALPGKSLALYVVGVDIAMEVYAEGRLLHRFGSFPEGGRGGRLEGWPYHIVRLPPTAAGKPILFRIWSNHYNIGLLSTPLLGDAGVFLLDVLQNSSSLLMVAALLAFVALLALAAFFVRRRNPEYFFFGSYALGLAAYMTARMPVKQVVFHAPWFWVHVEFFGLFICTASFVATVDLTLGPVWRNFTRRMWQIMFAYAIGAIVLSVSGVVPLLATLQPYQVLLTLFSLVLMTSIVVRAVRRNVEARILLVGFLGMITATALDVAISLRLFLVELQGRLAFIPWGATCVVVALGFIFIRRLVHIHRYNLLMRRQLETILRGTREMGEARERLAAVAKATEYVRDGISVEAGCEVILTLLEPHPVQEVRLLPEAAAERVLRPCEPPAHLERLRAGNSPFLSAHGALVVPVRWGSNLAALTFAGYQGNAIPDEERRFVETLATSLSVALSNIDFMEDSLRKAALERELETAALVQSAFLPRSSELPGVALRTSYLSAESTGGDWYGHHSEDGQVDFFIGDVTGHGLPAALMTGVLYGTIASHLRAGVAGTNPETRLQAIAEITNRVLHAAGKGRMNATMFFASLHLGTGQLTFLNAGHNPPFLVRADHTVQPLLAMGKRLGHDPEATFKVKTATLERGDAVFMYTDGLLENVGPEGMAAFSEKRLRELLGELSREAGFGFPERILDIARGVWKGQTPADDVTTLAFQLME